MSDVVKKNNHCLICGAIFPFSTSQIHVICPHCRAQTTPVVENEDFVTNSISSSFTADYDRLARAVSHMHLEGQITTTDDLDDITDHCASAIWAGAELLQAEDPNLTLQYWRQCLAPNGLLYMALPIQPRFGKAAFTGGERYRLTNRNVMMLLERAGFGLIWRSLRFQPTLRLIARKR